MRSLKLRRALSRLVLFVLGWAGGRVELPAAVYDYAANDGSGRALRLNMPDELAFVRGILIWGNGAGGDDRGRAEDAELVALARSLGFCLVATGQWGNFSDANQAELRLFEQALAQLAARSGRLEMVDAPWLPIGHSNGGQMSYGLNALRPERVIAIVASKGCCYNDPRPSAAALRTPGLLVAGERDTDLRRTNIHDLFTGNRPRGALWAWVEEEGMDHAEGESAELIRPFVEECVQLRLPADADPRRGPVTLRALEEASGWLVEPDSFKRGFAEIAPYADYTGDRRAAGWLPSARIAALFRAFASYRKGAGHPMLTGASGLFARRGAVLGYQVDAPAGDWREVEIFNGERSLARRGPGEPLRATENVGRAGYAVFHAVIRYASGASAVTAPRRVFVEPGAEPDPVREPVVLRASAATAAAYPVAFDWELRRGATGYRVEEASAAEGPWQAIAETSQGSYASPVLLAGATRYFRVVTLGADGELAAGVPLAVDATPRGGNSSRLRNLSARSLAGSGTATSIAGFAHAGGAGRVLVRALGPALAQLGLTGTLANPRLTAFRDGAVVAENDDWGRTPAADALAGLMAGAGVFALARDSLDAAAELALPGPAGTHTIVLGGGSGVAVLEIYDVGDVSAGHLVNLSARGRAGSDGEAFILGFEVGGGAPLTLLLRAAGPALGAFGLAEALPRPRVRLFRGDRELLAGDGWGANPNAADIRRAFDAVGAFAFAPAAEDAALFVTLAPGAYTFVITGRDGLAGVALGELYAWP